MEELKGIRKIVNAYSGLIFKIGLYLAAASSLFLFTNIFTEMYDTPKFLVILIFAALLMILMALRFTVTGRVVLLRTPLDLPLLLLLVVGIVSTVLSGAPYVSLLGNQLRIHTGLVATIAYVLFYFILTNNLKNAGAVKRLLTYLVLASQILAVLALATYMGMKILPAPWNHGLNFTFTGSSFSTTAILVLLLPFILMQILSASKPLFILANSLFLALSGLTIALTGSLPAWIAGGAALGLTIFVNNLGNLSNLKKLRPLNLVALIIPLVAVVAITGLSFIPPMGNTQNPLYARSQNFPREIQLDFVTSWKVAASAFRDSPFWGSGPSTFLFDFTNYKTIEFNSTKVWNLRFDSPFNEYLSVLATLGGVGLLALISLTALFVSAAYRVLSTANRLPSAAAEVGSRKSEVDLKSVLAISGIAFFIILTLHASTLPLMIIGLIVLASFMVINLSESGAWGREKVSDFRNMFLRIAANVTRTDSSQEIRVDALPGVILLIVLALSAFTGFMGTKLALADYHHRLALNAVAANQGIVAYNELVAAEKLNPLNDLYRTDLAQTNFALANAIAAAKGPTEASPGGSLTDQDKQNIQVLLSQSIAEGRTAVTLSPKSAINWEILALLYRQIAGVAQNALIFSLDSYGRSIFQDPLNPNLRLAVGGVYYAVRNYDMAIRFFTDAINIKPDFANGYFNLSVALRDKGDLAGAQVTAEKTLSLIDKNSSDFQLLSDYIADLKKRIDEGTTKESAIQPPASQTTGSLQQKELPKVINLPKPEKIATPEAIKKPEATPTPTPAPTQEP